MEIQTAKHLSLVLQEHQSKVGSYPEIREALPPEPLKNFHQWADAKPFVGGYLIRNEWGENLWVLLVSWNDTNGYYLVLFPEDKSGPIAEIHEHSVNKSGDSLAWRYKPTKRDGLNEQRKEYFEKYFRSVEVVISIPNSVDEVSEFLTELLSLAESREMADILSDNKPSYRDGFPEGKVKERMHRDRERNTKLIKQVKQEFLAKYGELVCQICSFNFQKVYGEIGSEFIEAHHTQPLSELDISGGLTKKEDIALVCSNCHRMLHRRRPWLEMAELKKLTRQ